MANVLLESVEYKVEETERGVWRRYLYESGAGFVEYKSHAQWRGRPVVHCTWGKCPETGRWLCARGVVAVGLKARGIVSIGLLSAGLVAVGLITVGLVSVGWLAIGLLFGFEPDRHVDTG